MSPIDAVRRELQYAFRTLRKTPAFTATALVTLAVGIGLNTAVFSVVHAVLLRPLPYPEPERLATIRVSGRGGGGEFSRDAWVDGATFVALRDGARLIDVAVQGSGGWGGGVNMIADNRAASVRQSRVSAGYFAVLGVRPLLGREFTVDEDREGGAAAVLVAHGLWTRLFNGDPGILGKSMMLRGEPHTIVGVMPSGFSDGTPADVWTPVRPSRSGEGGGTNYSLTARLRPGASWAEASAEADQLATPAFAPQMGRNVTGLHCALVPLQSGTTSEMRPALLMVWGAAGVVLVIACVNIAGLLLARLGARRRDIGVRMALGSSRGRVIRQLLVESAVLGLLGGLAGTLLGWATLQALQRLSADVFEFGYPIVLDARVLGATFAAALATSLIFGIVPALQASRVDVQRALGDAGTRSVARGFSRPRQALVVAEVALGVVLLVAAGLLVRTFVQLKGLAPGFDPDRVIAATVSLQDARYRDPARVAQLFERSLERLRSQPGVEGAAVSLGLPYTRLLNLGFKPLDGTLNPNRGTITNLSYVTPGYFSTLRIAMRDGRDFSLQDQAQSQPVAIVNEEFARRYYANGEAMGRHIRVLGDREIVGIAGNIRTTSSGFQGYNAPLVTPPIIYVPATQLNEGTIRLVHTWFSPTWVVKTSTAVPSPADLVRAAIAAEDPLLPVSKTQGLADIQEASIAPQRLMSGLVGGLGLIALLLAAVGLQGLIATSVTERTRELGVRLALGATSLQVLRTVVVPGLVLAGAGVVLGGAAALAVARLMTSFLWGVPPSDPWTYSTVAIVLMLVAFVSSLVPALRVFRLDPAVTLRSE